MISEVGLEIIIDNLIKNQFLKTLDLGNINFNRNYSWLNQKKQSW